MPSYSRLFRGILVSRVSCIKLNKVCSLSRCAVCKTISISESKRNIKDQRIAATMEENVDNVVPSESILPHRIGFVGAGQMALALAKGFMAAGLVAPDQVS